MEPARRVARLAVAASLAASCTGSASPRQVRGAAETAASWAAAVRLALAAGSEGRVTRRYVRHTLEQARRSVEDEARGLRGKPASPRVDTPAATAVLDREAALVGALQADLDSDDVAGLAGHAAELARVERQLRALAGSLGS